jgi:hypothetical protein
VKKENIINPTPEDIAGWEKLFGKVQVLEIETSFKTFDGEIFEEKQEAEDHVKEFVLPHGETPEDLELKAKMVKIEVTSVKAYLKKPSRKVISMATAVGGRDPIRFGELILENCWLGGDENIKTNDELFLAANSILGDLIKIRTATLKNY